jgi:hypothetical protein
VGAGVGGGDDVRIEDKVFGCGVPNLCKGRRMRPEKLAAWQALRERYGNRDESRVDRGRLLPPAA